MIDLQTYGFRADMTDDTRSGTPARITAVHKERYEIVCAEGLTHARLKSSVYFNGGRVEFPTTGDFVLIDYNPCGDSLITATLPRKTFFSRRDPTPGGGEQAVAANFDYVFIMQSLNHDFNAKRLERYLTLAWQSGAVPVVVLTKLDLVEDCSEQIREVERHCAGVFVCAVSAKSGSGLDSLSEFIKAGRTLVFLGSSGIGKSTLVNALAGEEIMNVNEIREDDSKGRHTTTHRQLIMLPCGAMIIDTPGMRELGVWDISDGLGQAFEDVERFIAQCRFSDCTHDREPGCAVHAAIESGELPAERWASYTKLADEARATEDAYDLRRRKDEWHKGIAKIQKQRERDMRKYGGKL